MAAVGDVLQARVLVHTASQIALNIRHYVVDAVTGTGANNTEIATHLSSALHAAYKGLMTTQATFRGVAVRRLRPLPIDIEGKAIANTGPGLITGDPLPGQITSIITLQTALAGRRERGRVYIPFPGETDSTSNAVPSAGYITALTNLANILASLQVPVGSGGTNTIAPCIFHRASGTITRITTVRPGGAWATQRRRGQFGAPNTPDF